MANADVNVIWQGIQKLMIVDVRLQQGIDNPQMIFESMNSTGKALTQADLIRNYILMGLEHDLQTRLYNDYWRPMEIEFGADNYTKHFDEFIRFFLVIKTGNITIRKGDVYDEFKSYARQHDVEKLLISVKEFSSYYCRVALGTESQPALAEVFHDIRELRADVCYPMLMEVYQDFNNQLITQEEFLSVLRIVESYVFRRAVCDIPTNSLRQTFASLMRQVKKDRYLESLQAVFLLLPSYRRFPKAEEFKRHLQSRNLYKFNRKAYWLRRFENYDRKERVPVHEYTIEHIMPQSENLNAEWKQDLGPEWERIHEQYLHTLGNLTLTGYNSEYSNRSFNEKRDMEGGFKQSPLKLNRGLGSIEAWNETAIKDRAKALSDQAIDIWAEPTLDEDTLSAYKQKDSVTHSSYSLSDHHHLQSGLSKTLFEQLSNQILALDECVSQEVLKLYIAFKAETNFADIVPQASGLRISLNLDLHELDDPRSLGKDVTGLGRWGNGNVQVKLQSTEDVPYIVGLIRQSLDKQL